MNSVESIEIPLSPRGDVIWEASDTANGHLYTPSPPETSVNPVKIIDAFIDNPSAYRQLGRRGREGQVHDVLGYAVKIFDRFPASSSIRPGGIIEDIQANVLLAEGLKRIPRPSDSLYSVGSVKLLASYSVTSTDDLGPRTFWLMEKLNPVANPQERKLKEFLPQQKQLHELYTRALILMGMDIRDVHFDDNDMVNTIITKRHSEAEPGKLVKIDTRAILPVPNRFGATIN